MALAGYLLGFIITCSMFLFTAKEVFAQIVINEMSTATTKDWVELYNTGDSEINLRGWSLRDSTSSFGYEFSQNTYIPSHGFCSVSAGNRLNNSGDKLELLVNGKLVDCVAYGDGNGLFCNEEANVDAPSDPQTIARLPNGEGNWQIATATFEYSNNDTIEPASKKVCTYETPTPKPTKAPATAAPAKASEPGTPTPQPNTVTPAPKKSPQRTPEPMREAESTVSGAMVEHELTLGIQNMTADKITPEIANDLVENKESQTKPALTLFFITLGAVSLLFGSSTLVKKIRKKV